MAALARIARTVFALPGPETRPAPEPVSTFDAAMAESDDLIRRFKESAADPHPIRALMADLWLQRHNVPYVTTVYEAVREVQSGTQFATVTEVSFDIEQSQDIARKFLLGRKDMNGR